MLSMEHVSKKYGKSAVYAIKDASFKIKKGEIVSLVGNNGAGKTTLVKIITGLVRPSSGVIKMFESKIKDTKENLGVLFEDSYFYPHLSGIENLRLLSQKDFPRDKLIKVAEIVNLQKELIYKKAGNLSHGQQRRLILASVLLRNPQLFILDEPFNGLDPAGVSALRKILLLEKSKGKSFLVTGQNLSYLTEIVDRIMYIKNGNIIFIGTPEESKKVMRGEIIIKTNSLEILRDFLISENIEFLFDNGKFFVSSDLETAKSIRYRIIKNNIDFSEYKFIFLENGGQFYEALD